jgi:hypothetical protein
VHRLAVVERGRLSEQRRQWECPIPRSNMKASRYVHRPQWRGSAGGQSSRSSRSEEPRRHYCRKADQQPLDILAAPLTLEEMANRGAMRSNCPVNSHMAQNRIWDVLRDRMSRAAMSLPEIGLAKKVLWGRNHGNGRSLIGWQPPTLRHSIEKLPDSSYEGRLIFARRCFWPVSQTRRIISWTGQKRRGRAGRRCRNCISATKTSRLPGDST